MARHDLLESAFDFRLGRKHVPPHISAMTGDLFAEPARGPRVLTVSEVTRSVRVCLEKTIGEVWVQGEIANYRQQSSGHQYFGLKDERASLACVLFFKNSLRLPTLADGMLVQVRGEMTVYEARGQYQLIVNLVQATGVGLLQAKFEALKRRLESEGLFAAERKRALPALPRRVGLVTSPTGAALHDMLNILQRRAPWLQIVINPVRVQGTGAAAEIAAAIRHFNEDENLPAVDVIVVCRGGGSAEDLWEFNEEIVARAIVASAIPVISAVGHEIDFTIADLAADLRAPTPSAAAELVVPEAADLTRRLTQLASRMQREVSNTLARWKAILTGLARAAVWREPLRPLTEWSQRLDAAEDSLQRAARWSLEARRQRVALLERALRQHRPEQIVRWQRQQLADRVSQLTAASARQIREQRHRLHRWKGLLRVLSPEATLSRGYSITTNAQGQIIRSVTETKSRQKLVTRLRDGSVISTVK